MSCMPGCATCEGLRHAALKIVGEGGIEALDHHSLAAGTRIPTAEVARHYPDISQCLYETYDSVVSDILLGLMELVREGSDWQAGFERARWAMLERLAANPAEARLCFVETLRGDRELRRRREVTRRRVVDFLTQEHKRRQPEEGLPDMQFEMLIGAGFQAISSAVSSEEIDLTELEAQLAEVQDCFFPQRA